MSRLFLIAIPLFVYAQGADRLSDLIMNMRRHHQAGDQGSIGRLVPLVVEEFANAHPDPLRALAWNQIGIYYATQGDLEQAERAYRRGIRFLDHRAPDGNLPILLVNLAEVYLQRTTRPGEAASLLERALKLAAEWYGPNSPDLTQCLHTLGSARQQLGDRRGAKQYFEKALSLTDDSLEGRTLRGIILSNMSVLSALDKDWSTARNRLLEGLELLRQSVGRSHPDLIRPYLNLATTSQHLMVWDEANWYVEMARLITEARLGSDHPLMAEVLETSAIILRKQGRVAEAKQIRRRARAIRGAQAADPPVSRVHVTDLIRR